MGCPGGKYILICPPEHLIMSFETIEIKMAAVSAKRSIPAIRTDHDAIFLEIGQSKAGSLEDELFFVGQ